MDLFLLKQTLLLSIVVALTGILLPIALSFLLIPIYAPLVSRLAAFAVGTEPRIRRWALEPSAGEGECLPAGGSTSLARER